MNSEFIKEGCIQMIEGREDVGRLLGMERYVDMVIPRGGKALVEYCQGNTRIPVLGIYIYYMNYKRARGWDL